MAHIWKQAEAVPAQAEDRPTPHHERGAEQKPVLISGGRRAFCYTARHLSGFAHPDAVSA